jgi:hypothetical protein
MIAAPTTEAASPAAEPSRVFFGEIRGANLVVPNFLPTK